MVDGGMRRIFQSVLILLSLIPLIFGLSGIAFGTERFLDADAVVPQLDGQFRYLSAWYLSLTFMIWWIVPRFEEHGPLFKIICGTIFLGGLARAFSWAMVGPPPAFQMGAMVLELSIPLLAIWQHRFLPR
jgi:Domain of unknown function (DUF4345)